MFSKMYGDRASDASEWIDAVCRFFTDPEPPKDFRLTRIRRLIVHRLDFVEALGPGRLTAENHEARSRCLRQLHSAD